MRTFSSYYPNRTICDVLDEMRKMNETRNYAALTGCIEEAQAMANRMEAALYDQKDFISMKESMSKLKKDIKKLKAEKKELDQESEDEI